MCSDYPKKKKTSYLKKYFEFLNETGTSLPGNVLRVYSLFGTSRVKRKSSPRKKKFLTVGDLRVFDNRWVERVRELKLVPSCARIRQLSYIFSGNHCFLFELRDKTVIFQTSGELRFSFPWVRIFVSLFKNE